MVAYIRVRLNIRSVGMGYRRQSRILKQIAIIDVVEDSRTREAEFGDRSPDNIIK